MDKNVMKCCICGSIDESHTAYCENHGRVPHEMDKSTEEGDWISIKQGEYKRLKIDDPKNANSYTARIGHKFFKRKEECKEHKWRVGWGKAELIKGKLITTQLIIWCENCPKRIKANYFSDIELEEKMKGKRR